MIGSRRTLLSSVVALVAAVTVATACSSDSATNPDAVVPSEGYLVNVELVHEGLVGPTQLATGPDGTWFVAQINGDENDGQGQIVAIDPTNPELAPQVIVDELDKPTGVAVFGGDLWIMERRRLTRGGLDGSGRHVVIDDLPFNGRSEGALTVDGDRLLFDTSGQLDGDGVVTDSGVLWAVGVDEEITPVATGFKHAYVQTRTPDGTLLSTEISDGRYDGNVPADEIVSVIQGASAGWPQCVGDNVVVTEYGGDAETCAQIPASYAVFAPGATPTGIAVAPWDPTIVLVALWNEQRVVAVSGDGTKQRVMVTVDRPQHLTVDGDGVLLTDHGAGTILRLTAPTNG